MRKIKIGVSKCLLGDKVRYDGRHKLDQYITGTLGRFFEYTATCPEVECGLPVPREAIRLVGKDKDHLKLMTCKTGKDITPMMVEWANKRLDLLEKEDICGYIFKSKSPSCGMIGVKIYSEDGMPRWNGSGIFAGMLLARFPRLPVIDEGRLHAPILREAFIEHVFVYYRWQELNRQPLTAKRLQQFHAEHKYLLMSHNQKNLTELGRIAAGTAGKVNQKTREKYFQLLTETMRLHATTRKHVNVLMHLIGYFKKDITGDEKCEFLNVVDNFQQGLVPLIVPLTLLKHYMTKYKKTYLESQWYIEPHPLELMLRNHV
jgi:uncharacterized protein YbgA (DUF1722 family)/uncharacterized protein YbbK (DUF523 family)